MYATLDVLMNASMGEGFGLTVLEAQACGVPAIVTDFTAMSEVCGAGWKVGYDRYWTDQSSWQARPHLEELVESLEASYAQSTAEREALSAQARAHALAYDADRVLDEYWTPALDELARRLGV
jgi:glycosyltransferase involved in cell wall biosynthesis